VVVGKPLGDRMWREEEEGHAFVASCSTSSAGSGQRNIMVRGGGVSMEKIRHHQRTGGVVVVGVVVGKPLGDLMWREEEEGHAFVESPLSNASTINQWAANRWEDSRCNMLVDVRLFRGYCACNDGDDQGRRPREDEE